jgi:hypothetical protein
MENIVRTVYGANLQTSQYLNRPVQIPVNSTLNEKFSVNADATLNPGEMPAVKYIAIGIGGHQMATGTNNISYPVPVQHLPRHAALYSQLPFVMRPLTDDLASQDRLKYRLRVIQTYNSIQYACYYLKVLDLTTTVVQLNLMTVQDGVTTSTPFTPALSDLNPTPPPLNNQGQNITTGDYIEATAQVPFVLTPDDLTEFLNVCGIIYGDANYSFISEIALVSGVDRLLTGPGNGAPISYTDAIALQITSFINVFYAAQFSNAGISLTLDIGNVEPMLAVSTP